MIDERKGRYDPTWPYGEVEGREAVSSEPSWECAAGFCLCHAAAAQEAPPHTFSIVLCDEAAERMAGARCRVLADGLLVNEDDRYADGKGRIAVSWRRLPETVLIEWAPREVPLEPRYPFRRLHYVDLSGVDRREAAARRLHNLGHSAELTLEDNIRDFQQAYGLDVTGQLDDVEQTLIRFNDRRALPSRATATVRSPAPTTDPGKSVFTNVAFTSMEDDPPDLSGGPGGIAVPLSLGTGPAILRVRWANPDHELLSHRAIDNLAEALADRPKAPPDAAADEEIKKRVEEKSPFPVTVTVKAHGKAENPTWRRRKPSIRGFAEFLIPGDVTHIDVRVIITPTYLEFGSVDKVVGAPVFDIQLRLIRDENGLFQHDGVLDGTRTVEVQGTPPKHMLAGETLEINGERLPTTELPLLTTVVDATDLFRKVADPESITIFETVVRDENRIGIQPAAVAWDAFRMLGFTGSPRGEHPFLFLAFVPTNAHDTTAPDVNALVFFRPKDVAYSSLYKARGIGTEDLNKKYRHTMSRSSRYMLAGRSDVASKAHGLFGFVHTIFDNGSVKAFDMLNMGLASSVQTSKKSVVLFSPIPSRNGYGKFVGASLLPILESAVRLLWCSINPRQGAAIHFLAEGNKSKEPVLGRLGLAGFSNGGVALRTALSNHWAATKEVYAFDPLKPDTLFELLVRWMQQADQDRILCLTAGLDNITGSGMKSFLSKHTDFGDRLFGHPDTDAHWGPAGNPDIGSVWTNTISGNHLDDEHRNFLLLPTTTSTDTPVVEKAPGKGERIPVQSDYYSIRPGTLSLRTKALAHQFALHGGGTFTIPNAKDKDKDTTSDYLTYFLRHRSRFP